MAAFHKPHPIGKPIRLTERKLLTIGKALGRMRFTLETLKNAKVGKIVVKLTKDPNSGKAHTLFFEINNRETTFPSPGIS
jgi:hypothetical protein